MLLVTAVSQQDGGTVTQNPGPSAPQHFNCWAKGQELIEWTSPEQRYTHGRLQRINSFLVSIGILEQLTNSLFKSSSEVILIHEDNGSSNDLQDDQAEQEESIL